MEFTKILLSLIFLLRQVFGAKLSISNDGPVVVGSNISFVGEIEGEDMEYKWIWSDDFDPSTKIEIKARKNCNFTHQYDRNGEFTMTVEVYYNFFHVVVATARNKFRISEEIPGHLEVFQNGVLIPEKQYLSSANETNLLARVYDPSGYLKQSLIYFTWTINSNYIEGANKENLTYVFDPPETWHVLAVVTAFNPQTKHYLSGSFTTIVRSQAPIENINITGNIMLQRGDLVDLDVECDGSGPWSSCWMAVPEINGTVDDNVTCTEFSTSNDCEFEMIHYFDKTGHHQMLINISNDINRLIRFVDINIYNAVPEPQLSTVIIPVVCSLLAVAIIVVGFLYYIQSRHRFIVEVADFDFTSSDTFTYRSFYEQLKDAFMESMTTFSDGRQWNILDCHSESGQTGESEGQSSHVELDKGDFITDDIERRPDPSTD